MLSGYSVPGQAGSSPFDGTLNACSDLLDERSWRISFYTKVITFNTALSPRCRIGAHNKKIGSQPMKKMQSFTPVVRSSVVSALKSTAAAAILVIAATSNTMAGEQSAPRAKVLVDSTVSWEGVKYEPYPSGQTKLTLLKITIPPHTALPWHHHPVANIAYVISGELTIEDRLSKKTLKVKSGEAFPESVGASHRGVTGEQEAVVIVAYAGIDGVPLSVPDKNEKAEFEHLE
jgi:quercetin dioxygenase-like cupin family protein